MKQKSIAPESALKRLQEIAASRQEEELANYRAVMEREKEERLKRIQAERARQVCSSTITYGVFSLVQRQHVLCRVFCRA